jgi:GT2 family glycosyltransferase
MISVILVTFNSINVLPGCLASLERCSSAGELEIILVDNASTDGTPGWIVHYQSHVRSFSVRSQLLSRNNGYAYANNRGLEMAQGEILLLLNPDTVVGYDAIARCEETIREDHEIGAVGCRLELPDGRLDRACKRSFPTFWNSFTRLSGLSLLFPGSRWLSLYNLTFLDEHASYPVDCVCGAFMMISRATYENVGGLDEAFFMYGEDIDWCYRIKKAGWTIWYLGAATTAHYKGGNGGKRSRQSLYHFYDTMYVYYVRTLGNESRSLRARLLRLLLRVMFYVHTAGNARL